MDSPEEIRLKFYGGVAKLVACTSPAALIDGPAGTGKTRGVLQIAYMMAEEWPGCRILFVRKTRTALTESVLVTFETKVCPEGAPCLEGPTRAHRQSYDFPNGSHIVCGGMDNADRIMSTEYDLICCFEATELSEDDAEKLMTRLRNGKVPWQQIIFDCNPGPPTHWLKRWADGGRCERFPSRHEDNPTVTPAYLAVLDGLTGHRRLRLRDGLWAAAEGAVYPEWDASVHLIDPFPIPASWRRFRSIDFGYTNPFVCQWWAVDGDGRMYLYREIYKSRTIVEDHAKVIKQFGQGEKCDESVTDHDAEDRATLERHGFSSMPARKDVTVGIQAVSNRLRCAGDGRPRLFILRDCRVDADPALAEGKHPTCTAEEFDGYCWQPDKDGKPTKEEPVKVDDHGMDAMRYAVMHLDAGVEVGASLVQSVRPQGPRPTLADKQPVPVDVWAERRKNPEWGWEKAR